MKFFKGKAAKWIATTALTGVLLYVGVPPKLATALGNWGGGEIEEIVD